MVSSGERLDLERGGRPDRRQALHRRGRRQGLADPGAAGGQLRGGRAAAVRAAASATPAARWTSWSPSPAGGPAWTTSEIVAVLRDDRLRDLRRGPRPGPGRPAAVRAARRHRDGRVDPADRQLDHVQEDRRGDRRAGPGREGRQRRVHAGPGPARGRWRRPWSSSATSPRRPHQRPADQHGHAARARPSATRVEVDEAVATLRGDGPADLVEVTLALAARDAARWPACDGDPAAALADGRALARYRAMIAAQGGDPDAPLPRAAHTEVVTARRRRLPAAAGRAGGRRGGLAAGRRAGPARRTRSARPPASSAWSSRASGSTARPARAGAARRRARPVRPGPGRAGGRHRDRPAAAARGRRSSRERIGP